VREQWERIRLIITNALLKSGLYALAMTVIKNIMTNQPLLICMTPVRNEAWILHAFLKATSLWADHIIIADQNSNRWQ